MQTVDKIIKIQDALKHPGNEEMYYKLLEDMGDLKKNYSDYMTTEPINIDEELGRVPEADYELCTALLTTLLREDHFSNGLFQRWQRAGEVNMILERMLAVLSE